MKVREAIGLPGLRFFLTPPLHTRPAGRQIFAEGEQSDGWTFQVPHLRGRT